MSKSILVIDTPENCRECPCHFTDMVTFSPKEGEKFFSNLCGANNNGLNVEEMNKRRPDWCPLREIPKKSTILSAWVLNVATTLALMKY